MKHIRLGMTVLVFVSLAVPAAAAQFGSVNTRNCTWCHGASAQGYDPAPRLAGQRPLYFKHQLNNFIEHRRDNPLSKLYMWHAVANIDSLDVRALADYFSKLHPEAADNGRKELVAAGRQIFQVGIPASNIVACVACHGPRAQGVRQIPRLGGLSYSYLQRRLEQWHDGYDKYALHPMRDVAGRLSEMQISQLASYLSYVKK